MKKHMTAHNTALLAIFTAVSATAWAASETIFSPPSQSTIFPMEQRVLAPSPPLATSETLDENETLIIITDAPPAPRAERAAVAPVAEPVAAAEPPITIEQKRLTRDERIQSEVLDRLAAIPNVSGRIGVETNEAVVTLTGLVTTSGQAYRAGREARGVDGVRYVDNRIRAKVGA